MRARAVILALALVLAPLGAKAADLVVWWEKGVYADEDKAVREIAAAFEQKTGKQGSRHESALSVRLMRTDPKPKPRVAKAGRAGT
jgi:hypothetical protein